MFRVDLCDALRQDVRARPRLDSVLCKSPPYTPRASTGNSVMGLQSVTNWCEVKHTTGNKHTGKINGHSAEHTKKKKKNTTHLYTHQPFLSIYHNCIAFSTTHSSSSTLAGESVFVSSYRLPFFFSYLAPGWKKKKNLDCRTRSYKIYCIGVTAAVVTHDGFYGSAKLTQPPWGKRVNTYKRNIAILWPCGNVWIVEHFIRDKLSSLLLGREIINK